MRRGWLYLTGGLSVLGLATQGSVAIATPVSGGLAEQNPEVEQGSVNDGMAQVTSVSQLADVQETDWAYQALRSLSERYGVILGYPDNTYRGNRSMTRYEFAAGLNTFLLRVDELITTGLEGQISGTDLTTLRRLQEDFRAELDDLQTRIDGLEVRGAELDANLFSTTTRLTGETIVAINGGFSSDESPSTVVLGRVRLNLETSFTGQDRLFTQLQVGNRDEGIDPNNDAAGFLLRHEGEFRDDLVDAGNALTDQSLRRLGVVPENFPNLRLDDQDSLAEIQDTLAGNLRELARAGGASPAQAENVFDRIADAVEVAQGINGFLQTNSTLEYAGADQTTLLNRLSYTFSPWEDVNVSLIARGYASDYVDSNRYANNHNQNFSTYGLINNQLLLANDPAGAGAALVWNPGGDFFTLRAVYLAEQAAIATHTPNAGNQGGLFGDPYLGVVELGFAPSNGLVANLQYSSGAQGDNEYDVVGANVQVNLNRQLALFGRFGYAFSFPGDFQPTSWSAGVAVADLIIPGASAGIAMGQPLILQDDELHLFDGIQTNFEAFYRLPLSDNISITPLIQLITSPGNREGSAIFTGTLRTVFSF